MKVSVILCTYKRCQSLATALESLARQNVPESIDWEVVVVDNNSPDRTAETVAGFSRRDPKRFRYVFEGCQGKSFALNTGIREARGDVLAFVDDDVTVDASWLSRLTAPFAESDCAGVGGRVVPAWKCRQPDWLEMHGPFALRSVLAMFDLGDQPGELSKPPAGTNMAFRREVFQKYGGFRTDLGPTVGSEIRGEDSEFYRRLAAGGERLRYEPTAIVCHPVEEHRLRKTYFQAWFYDCGRARVREDGIPAGTRCWWGVPQYLLRALVERTAKWILALESCGRFYYKVRVWQTAGEIVEAYRQSLRTKESV